MKKKFWLSIMLCCFAFCGTAICNVAATESMTVASTMIPATGDVTSIVALTLVGVAAIGGFLLRRAK